MKKTVIVLAVVGTALTAGVVWTLAAIGKAANHG